MPGKTNKHAHSGSLFQLFRYTTLPMSDPQTKSQYNSEASATALMVLHANPDAALRERVRPRDDDASSPGAGIGRLVSDEPAAIASAQRD
tara:strand:- start:12530 stop:12799 length:270 start_codon:yes stop_codon:yes gene_type:complete